MKIENYRDVEFVHDMPLSFIRKGDKGATIELYADHYLVEVHNNYTGDEDIVEATDDDVREVTGK